MLSDDYVQGQGNAAKCLRFAVLDEAGQVMEIADL